MPLDDRGVAAARRTLLVAVPVVAAALVLADLLSALDVVNHSNTELLALDDVLGGARADPVVHASVYASDGLNLELVYVPFLAPDLVAIGELAIDSQFTIVGTTFDVDARFLNPPVTPFSEWAHSVHAVLSYSTFVADLQVSYSYYRDQLLDFDLSGLVERRSADGTRYDITGTVRPAYRRAHNFGIGASLALDGWVVSADAGFKFAAQNPSDSRIDIKNPELVTVLQADHAFSIGSQPFTMLAGVYHRQILHDSAAWQSRYSPFLEAYVGTLPDQYLLQHRPAHLVPGRQVTYDPAARAPRCRSARRLGHHRGGVPPRPADQLRRERHAVGSRRRQPLVAGRRLRQRRHGPAPAGRRQGQRVPADHAALLTPPAVGSALLPR